LIVTHHPCIFPKSRGLSKVSRGSNPSADLVYQAIRGGLSVIVSHTNFDRCALEVVKAVSEGLGVTPRGRLLDHPEGALLKLVVYVPEIHAESVREAVCAAGAGQIGQYDSCSFGAPGEGTFRGGEETQPFLGKPGKLERAREVRLETVLPRGIEK